MTLDQRSPAFLTRRFANGTGFLVCCALMAYAFYAQYVQFLDPCPLCLFQRFVVIGIGVVFLLAALHNPKQTGARIYAITLVIMALAGIGLSAKHIWIQAQPPGTVASCGAGLSYLIDIMPLFDVIKKVLGGSGECAHIDTIFGISWPWWTGVAFVGLGTWGGTMNWLGKKS
jgi:disulfide bond formation protein DsbB